MNYLLSLAVLFLGLIVNTFGTALAQDSNTSIRNARPVNGLPVRINGLLTGQNPRKYYKTNHSKRCVIVGVSGQTKYLVYSIRTISGELVKSQLAPFPSKIKVELPEGPYVIGVGLYGHSEASPFVLTIDSGYC